MKQLREKNKHVFTKARKKKIEEILCRSNIICADNKVCFIHTISNYSERLNRLRALFHLTPPFFFLVNNYKV